MLKFLDSLWENPLQGLSGECISGILGKFFTTELKIMVIIEFPEADIDDIEIFIAEEVGIEIDIVFSLYIE